MDTVTAFHKVNWTLKLPYKCLNFQFVYNFVIIFRGKQFTSTWLMTLTISSQASNEGFLSRLYNFHRKRIRRRIFVSNIPFKPRAKIFFTCEKWGVNSQKRGKKETGEFVISFTTLPGHKHSSRLYSCVCKHFTLEDMQHFQILLVFFFFSQPTSCDCIIEL